MNDRVVRLTFPAKAEYLLLARLALSGLARELPIEEELLADLKLAVTEACGNVVRHAYPGDEEGDLSLVVTIGDGRLLLTVEDYGAGIRAPDLPEDEAPTSSRSRSRAAWGCRSSARSWTSWPSRREPTAAGRSCGW